MGARFALDTLRKGRLCGINFFIGDVLARIDIDRAISARALQRHPFVQLFEAEIPQLGDMNHDHVQPKTLRNSRKP